jgi:carbon monoxide dehydrogenase subunit G
MEVDKRIRLSASPAQIWQALLDPVLMPACVPGLESLEVVSPTEYLATVRVKVSFVTAAFRIRTSIVEQVEPRYLRSTGQGEDNALASSLRHDTEVMLEAQADGGTELRIRSTVDVLGKVGNLGLSAMKTKADRMWDAFGEALAGRLSGDPVTQ